MRSNDDAAIEAAARSRPRSPRGGKALQRLFYYLGRRDRELNDEVVSGIPVPRASRPRFQLTEAAMAAAPGRPVAGAARARRRASQSFAAALIDAASALAQTQTAPSPAPGAAPGPPPAAWQWIGPSVIPNGQTYGTNRIDVIGRVAAVAVDPGNANHVLCGGAGGGIWESFDRGATWAVRTDQMPSLAIGAIAFDPQQPRIVYAGSGEGNFYFNLGAGVYQSTDGGTTWRVLASAPFVGVGFFALVVSPSNPQNLYAATTAGFYASANSGASWTQRRAARCWGVSVSPTGGAGAEILASFADGLFVSTNGGAAFAQVALSAAPTGQWTRLDVDRVIGTPAVAYVFGATGQRAYLWRRTGTRWTRVALPSPLNITQAWYDWYVKATPDNVNQVFLGAIDAYRGDLAGRTWTWTDISTQGNHSIHPDQHCLAFAPGGSRTIYAGSDGGLFRSADSGASWDACNRGLGITEVEYIASDPTASNWLMAGLQDNGTIRFAGAGWDHIADGDGGDCAVNPLSPNQIYHSYYYVSLERSNDKGNSWVPMNPPSMQSLFYPPVCVYGTTVAIGGDSLAVTRNGAPPWSTVALGLAANDVATASCIRDANTIYLGTLAGRVMRLDWNGTSWATTTLTSPFAGYVSCIAIDANNAQRLWVTSSQLSVGAMVCRSDDGGATWVNCSIGLPPIPKNTVVVDPANSNLVWVGADVGVYQSTNMGGAWSAFSTGLPNAMAVDLLLHQMDRKLYCATRNRGVWVASV